MLRRRRAKRRRNMSDCITNPENPLGVAVIGAGYWGKNLVRNFHSLGALRVICDPEQARLDSFAAACPGIACTADLDAVFGNPAVAGVTVATPAETHYAIVKKALLAGKHVLVEKPMDRVRAETALDDMKKVSHRVSCRSFLH